MIRKKANFGKCLSILVNEVVPVVAGFDNKYVFISTNRHLTFNRRKKKKNLRPHRDISTHMYTHLFFDDDDDDADHIKWFSDTECKLAFM